MFVEHLIDIFNCTHFSLTTTPAQYPTTVRKKRKIKPKITVFACTAYKINTHTVFPNYLRRFIRFARHYVNWRARAANNLGYRDDCPKIDNPLYQIFISVLNTNVGISSCISDTVQMISDRENVGSPARFAYAASFCVQDSFFHGVLFRCSWECFQRLVIAHVRRFNYLVWSPLANCYRFVGRLQVWKMRV